MSAHEERAALAAAAGLVVVRSLVFLAYEHAHFDADQAINGLMAKHLVEGRAFPLFFYGQGYMLAVEAWMAAPWLWAFGPSVAALRASIVLTNLVVAGLLVVGLHRGAGLRPWQALAAASFFVLAPPLPASNLLEAQGANVEVFLTILLLWFLRARPLAFGIVAGIGFLNREFTLYAIPVLLAGEAVAGRLWTRGALHRWALALVAAVAVWEVVMSLQPYADLLGPGTRGELLGGFPGDPLENLRQRGQLQLADVPRNLASVIRDHGGWLLGYRAIESDIARQGHGWLAWPLGMALVLVSARFAWLALGAGRTVRDRVVWAGSAAFAWYVLGVGTVALAAYVATRPPTMGTVRYVLLVLLVPVGVAGVALALEPRRFVRAAIATMIAVWASASAWDSGRLLRRYVLETPPNPVRELVETLEARGVTVAEADYWLAYKATYIARERVKIASRDVVRIAEYQTLAGRAGPGAVWIRPEPCDGGEQVAGWYLCGQE